MTIWPFVHRNAQCSFRNAKWTLGNWPMSSVRNWKVEISAVQWPMATSIFLLLTLMHPPYTNIIVTHWINKAKNRLIHGISNNSTATRATPTLLPSVRRWDWRTTLAQLPLSSRRRSLVVWRALVTSLSASEGRLLRHWLVQPLERQLTRRQRRCTLQEVGEDSMGTTRGGEGEK